MIDSSVFARLRSGRTERACLQEIEELFAAAERVRDIPVERLAEVEDRHGVDLQRQLRPARRKLYRCFLEHCLMDQALSEREREELAHLRRLLHLSAGDAAELHEQVAADVYGVAVASAFDDLRLEPEEEMFLRRLREDLALPGAEADALVERGRAEAAATFIERHVVYEDAYSPDRKGTLHVEGDSEESLQEAIRLAAEAVARAVPDVERAEVVRLEVDLEAGRVVRWRAKVRARLPG